VCLKISLESNVYKYCTEYVFFISFYYSLRKVWKIIVIKVIECLVK